MIDYTQYAFQSPAQVIDPIPTVSDYLDDYTARNEAWYQSWAYPMGGGQYGARPSSFERRAPYIEPPQSTVTDEGPPLIEGMPRLPRETGTGQTEDRPIGQIVRDTYDMSDMDLFNEYEATKGVVPMLASSIPAAVMGVVTGTGLGIPGGMIARSAMEGRSMDLLGSLLSRATTGSLFPNETGVEFNPGAPGTIIPDYVALVDAGYEEASGVNRNREGGGGRSGGYSSADRSGRNETTSEPGGIGGV